MTIRLAAFLLLSVSTASAAQTVQARFESATTKLAAGDAAGALTELDALQQFLDGQAKPNPFNIAITRAMRAEALVALGRSGEAREVLTAALAGPWLDRAGLEPMRDSAQLLSAKLMEEDLDHAGAAKLFLEVAQRTSLPRVRAAALIGAARTEMFVDAPTALRHVDDALKLAEADAAVGKAEMANILGLKGRILLNGGQFEEARALLVRAVELRGGLTTRTDLGDVALRADAGISFLRIGRSDIARKYLAFSGAGLSEVPLPSPLESELPPCGGEADIQPDDVAVIEFTVLDDGRVAAPRPVFASRQGEMAYVFARAVSRWSWDPEKIRAVKLFYRFSPRVELRCTNQAARPSVLAEFEQATDDWFAAQGAPVLQGSAAEVLSALRKQFDALPAAERSARRLSLLVQLARNDAVPVDAKAGYLAEAVELARTLRAPAPVRFLVAVNAAMTVPDRNRGWRKEAEDRAERLQAILATDEVRDPRSRAALRSLVARALANARKPDDEIAALRAVADDGALPDRDPLKVAALVSLANAYAARNDMTGAAAAYARTGLSAQQCALLDGGPALSDPGFGRFPDEANQWGFEGWAFFEYDIAADGRTRNPRVVAAFPPQVFSRATEELTRTLRYRVSFRPDGDTACTAMRRRVRYTMTR